MTKTRKWLMAAVLLAAAILTVGGFLCLPARVASAEEWTIKALYREEGGEYVCEEDGSAVVEYMEDKSGFNTFEAQFLYARTTADDGQVAIQINTSASYYLFYVCFDDPGFSFPVARLRYGESDVRQQKELTEEQYSEISPSAWMKMKLVLDTNYIRGYVNDVLCISLDSTQENPLLWQRALICSWKCPNRAKELSLSHTDPEREQPEVPQPDENFTPNSLYRLEDNVYICDTSRQESGVIEYAGDKQNFNTLEADLMVEAHGMGYVALQVNTSGGYYLFDLNPNPEGSPIVSRVIYNNGGDNILVRHELGESTFGGVALGQWVNFKLVLAENYLKAYINGEECYSAQDTHGETLWTRALVCSWDCLNRVKGLKFYHSALAGEQPPAEEKWIPDGNWTTATEEDTTVYSTTEYASLINYTGDLTGINTVEAEIRYVRAYSGEGYCALQVNTSGGYWLLDLAPNTPEDPVARVWKNDLRLTRQVLTGTGFGETGSGHWVHLKLVLDENYVIGYVNGKQMFKRFNTDGETLWTRVLICTWWDECSVRNIKLSHTQPDYSSVGYLDLEFSDERGVNGFSGENVDLSYENGSMALEVLENGTLTSPNIEENPGQRYSALLTMQNTLLVRMKNLSDADRVKISFITSLDGEWDEAKSKIFDLGWSGDFVPYYFNLSDVAGAEGYLRGFRMQFLGGGGSIAIDAITFEREDPIYPYAGEILSSTASSEKKSVTVRGRVNGRTGSTVTIWESSTQNYAERLDFAGLEAIATATVRPDGSFVASFPLMKGNTKRLAFLFLASVDGVKVDRSFRIENYRDFSDPVERFTVEGVVAKVSEFGAKGDSYTDDTAAIQSAIDYVDRQGGGTVILEGDPSSPYGKRYIATHLELCDNLEFRIEEGAILWQSSREADYKYEVTYGHDVDIEGLMWCHAGATVNLPLLFINEKQNVRITGEGTIRMTDVGAEQPDAEYFNGNPTLNVGCTSRIHILPICIYHSSHVDVTDITIARSNIWHMYMSFNEDLYIANVLEKEVGCATSDGFTVTSNKNVVIDRVMTYTSDDSIGICTCYDDPRGFKFRPARPGEDNANENIILRHSYFWGGFGISFIPWGSGAPNAAYEEIRGVEIHDCVLGGHKSVGCWPDDPFYGYSKNESYNNGEDHDYTAVKDVWFHNNLYLNSFELFLGNIRLPVTNLIVEDNDAESAKSPSSFLHGDFEKVVRTGEWYADESNFEVGLCYWSERKEEGATLGTQKIGGAYGYSAFIKGNGELFQGLYEEAGCYVLSLEARLLSGTGKVFVRRALDGAIVAERPLVRNEDYSQIELTFNLHAAGTYQLGVSHSGGEEEIVWLDNFSLERIGERKLPAFFQEDFEREWAEVLYSEEGALRMWEQGENFLRLYPTEEGGFTFGDEYEALDVQFDLRLVKALAGHTLLLRLAIGGVQAEWELDLSSPAWHKFGARLKGGKLILYLDGVPIKETDCAGGAVRFSAPGAIVDVDNIVAAEADSLQLERKSCKLDIERPEGVQVQFLEGGESVLAGDTVRFRLSCDRAGKLTVKLGERELLPGEEGVYTLTVEEDTSLHITFEEESGGMPEDPPEKDPPEEEDPPVGGKEEGGCGSIIGGTAVLLSLLLTAAVLLCITRKGEEK